MKSLIVIVYCLLSCGAFAADVEPWPHPPSAGMRSAMPHEKISEALFFEVPASRQDNAAYWHAKRSVIPVKKDVIQSFGQHNFQCATGMNPYLVRAVYENGGTGRYYVERFGTTLLVSHLSLGKPSGVHRSALLVCLGFQPIEVFHELGGAM
jgi:hypothetical protein